MKRSCDELGKRHRWKERDEPFSLYSTQSVGKYWICSKCGARSEDKPPDLG